jgi:hypothetical protein
MIEKLRLLIASKVEAKTLQIIGSSLLVAFYILLALAARKATNPDWSATLVWLCVGIPVGLIELLVIWVHDTTITKWIRSLANKRIDTIVMLALIFVTWWVAGPFASGFFFLGFLDNHFGEKQVD